MRIIYCHLQLFSNDQMIHVIDTEAGVTHYRKVDIEDLSQAICALANEYEVENIKFSGTGSVCASAWVEEIRSTLALNYQNNNIIVEVVE